MNTKTYFYKFQTSPNLSAVISVAIVSAVSFYSISLDKIAALHMGQF